MVVEEVIKNRLEKMAQCMKKISKYSNISKQSFLEDEIAQDVVEYNLFISINMMIDIATHIVVDHNMGKPNTLSEAFDILLQERYIDETDAEIYKNMVGFRNILSHEYIKINKEIVYEILKNNVDDLRKFILFIHNEFLG